MNLRSVARNAAVLNSLVNSKWIALVEKQMNSAIYDLQVFLPRPLLTRVIIGPAKSTPVMVNALEGLILSLGNDPIA